jgi:hypothetical protein
MPDDAQEEPQEEPKHWYITMVFPENMQQEFIRQMVIGGVVWSDFVGVSAPDYYRFPFQVQWEFAPRKIRGDTDYDDWRRGDTFIDESDPHGIPFVATKIDREWDRVFWNEPEEGETFTRSTNLRRIAKWVPSEAGEREHD